MDSFEIVVFPKGEGVPSQMGDQVYLVANVDPRALKDVQDAVAGKYERLPDGSFVRVCPAPPVTKPHPR